MFHVKHIKQNMFRDIEVVSRETYLSMIRTIIFKMFHVKHLYGSRECDYELGTSAQTTFNCQFGFIRIFPEQRYII